MNCVLVKDELLELLKEVKTHIINGTCCETCSTPCGHTGRCAMAMSNLMVDIQMLENSYQKQK